MSFPSSAIRNIAVAGHGSTGKTTVVEQMLFNGNVVTKAETVDSGKTVSDFTEEEIARGISIHTSFSNLVWNDKQINILDTPGASDFVGEVVAGFRAAEMGLMLVSADSGVQIETMKLWRRLNARNMPRIAFINKMDRERASFDDSFADLKDKFKIPLVPVSIPIGAGESYKGVVNLIENKAYLIGSETAAEIPADMVDIVEEYRLTTIESAAEGDDALLEKYFEEGTLSEDEIRHGLEEGLKNNKIVPVLCGAAEINSGIISLLNFISNNAPSPVGLKEKAFDDDGNEEIIDFDSEKPTTAFVFKTTIDQFSGRLSFFKVVTGVFKPDSEYLNTVDHKKERVGKIYKAVGKKIVETKELYAGDIGIFSKIESAKTNDSFCTASEHAIHYDKLKLPQPVHSVAISAESKKEEDKLNQFLQRAADQDLTFQVRFDKETKETVVSCMGELHLNIVLDNIKEKAKIGILTRKPRIAYRECITKSANAEYAHKKQSGGHGQYGKVVMEIKPISRDEKMNFVNAIKGGSISKGYMPGIEKGILEAMDEGYLAGYPIMGLEAKIVDGKEHPVDSSEMAFKLAGKGAVKAAFEKAGVKLLEPIMNLKVFCEEKYMGDILSDLSSKRGRVQGQEPLGGGILEIDAQVPQGEMLNYSVDLRSITSGTASFEMEFDHYDPISGAIADKVIADAKASKEE
ncbi:MAG: elongation factor G [Spirochaetales bacterium]|uniref:Elongation factor G n=1 Tax=Candidatus Thalassospirochaeta sargassi TaxID=3119039 RepID=A0AAJ1IDC6_9SPIO|nr:elongation factor G [Spirochaetales bacterium]